jgi:hypothetical protein
VRSPGAVRRSRSRGGGAGGDHGGALARRGPGGAPAVRFCAAAAGGRLPLRGDGPMRKSRGRPRRGSRIGRLLGSDRRRRPALASDVHVLASCRRGARLPDRRAWPACPSWPSGSPACRRRWRKGVTGFVVEPGDHASRARLSLEDEAHGNVVCRRAGLATSTSRASRGGTPTYAEVSA